MGTIQVAPMGVGGEGVAGVSVDNSLTWNRWTGNEPAVKLGRNNGDNVSNNNPLSTAALNHARTAPALPTRLGGKWKEPGEGEVEIDPLILTLISAPDTEFGKSVMGGHAYSACLMANEGFQPLNFQTTASGGWKYTLSFKGVEVAAVTKNHSMYDVVWLGEALEAKAAIRNLAVSHMSLKTGLPSDTPWWFDQMVGLYAQACGVWSLMATQAVRAEVRGDTLCFNEGGGYGSIKGTFYDIEDLRANKALNFKQWHFGEVFPPLYPVWREAGLAYSTHRARRGLC